MGKHLPNVTIDLRVVEYLQRQLVDRSSPTYIISFIDWPGSPRRALDLFEAFFVGST